MEQFLLSHFWCEHWCWPGFHTLTNFICTVSLSVSLYPWKMSKNLNIPISIISFIDDGLFISQNKSFHISDSCLYCSYNVMTKLLEKFDLIVEHSNTEVFYFNRSHRISWPHTHRRPCLMAQEHMEILGLYLWQETGIPPTHWLLLQQDNVHC